MYARLKNYRQAPRKVRLVADSVQGKNVAQALQELTFARTKAAGPMKKLIASAVANARQKNDRISEDDLYVESIAVDKGVTYFRYMPRAFGRASPIRRESSHVAVVLTERPKSAKIKNQNAK